MSAAVVQSLTTTSKVFATPSTCNPTSQADEIPLTTQPRWCAPTRMPREPVSEPLILVATILLTEQYLGTPSPEFVIITPP